jgi:predicted transcriptional regulator
MIAVIEAEMVSVQDVEGHDSILPGYSAEDTQSRAYLFIQNIILYYERSREKLSMKPKTVSFRIEEKNLTVVDEIARAKGVDRTAIINTAIEEHIAYYRWSCEHIQRALDSTDMATEEEVQAEFDKWKQAE